MIGTFSDGMFSNGTFSDGMFSDGMFSDGTFSDGMFCMRTNTSPHCICRRQVLTQASMVFVEARC